MDADSQANDLAEEIQHKFYGLSPLAVDLAFRLIKEHLDINCQLIHAPKSGKV